MKKNSFKQNHKEAFVPKKQTGGHSVEIDDSPPPLKHRHLIIENSITQQTGRVPIQAHLGEVAPFNSSFDPGYFCTICWSTDATTRVLLVNYHSRRIAITQSILKILSSNLIW